MPRRPSVRNKSPQLSPPPQQVASSPPPALSEPLAQLRTQWKWAAFSQFFFTFNHLFPMNDISLNDIEDDLVRGSSIVLPRIMQRLLYTLSYDRKVSLDNWQTALRKQHRKRDPAANPIGPEPRALTPEPRSSSPAPDADDPPILDSVTDTDVDNKPESSIQLEYLEANTHVDPDTDAEIHPPESTRASTLEVDRGLSLGASTKGLSVQPSEPDSFQAPSGHFGDHCGEQEESKDWLELPMLTKLNSMHLVTEWQFQNPMRLRTLMRSDNDDATWRIEPIGYDSKKNAYWLIGADRLWLQRPIPRPPRPPKSRPKPTTKLKAKTSNSQTLKRKRGAGPTPTSPSKSKSKRPRIQDSPSSPSKEPSTPYPVSGTGRGRVAKAQANIKLDAQAKELADLNRQATALAWSQSGPRGSRRGLVASRSTTTIAGSDASPSRKGKDRDRAMGTRISARLRRNAREPDDEEWQAVPQEWLTGEEGRKMSNGKGTTEEAQGWLHEVAVRTGLERGGSELSDLTELSEENGGGAGNGDGNEDEDGEGCETFGEEEEEDIEQDVKQEELRRGTKPVDERGLEVPPILPEGFVEWETICVSLYEWEHIAERFAKATHYLEKSLYKVLVNHVVPEVTEELREIDRKQRLSLAITQRKRSSRLLLRQSEREEAEAAARKLAEEGERHSRARRAEARQRKEEADRERRETARETRRKEREEREERERMIREGSNVDVDDTLTAKATAQKDMYLHIEVMDDDAIVSQDLRLTKPSYNATLPDSRYSHNGNGRLGTVTPATGSGSRTPAGDDWELDCEICHRHGINIDDGTPMMSCGLCAKWQHITCHDRADQQAGRRRRNWDVVEFFCLKCRAQRAGVSLPNAGGTSMGLRPSTSRDAGQVQLAMNTDTGQLGQNPHLGNGFAGNGGTPYGGVNSNSYTGAVGSQPAPRPTAVNGSSRSYARERHVSNIRSVQSVSMAGVHPQQHQQHQQRVHEHEHQHQSQLQPYGATSTIAFSHYQPQQRGFSSSPQYNASGHTQPYGQYAINTSSPYGQSSQQQTSQARWNVITPAQHASSFSTLPYASATPTTNISGVGYGHHHQRSTIASPHIPAARAQSTQWQDSNRLPPPVDSQNVNLQQQQIQHAPQFRYQPTSYQSPTS